MITENIGILESSQCNPFCYSFGPTSTASDEIFQLLIESVYFEITLKVGMILENYFQDQNIGFFRELNASVLYKSFYGGVRPCRLLPHSHMVLFHLAGHLKKSEADFVQRQMLGKAVNSGNVCNNQLHISFLQHINLGRSLSHHFLHCLPCQGCHSLLLCK